MTVLTDLTDLIELFKSETRAVDENGKPHSRYDEFKKSTDSILNEAEAMVKEMESAPCIMDSYNEVMLKLYWGIDFAKSIIWDIDNNKHIKSS